MSYLRILESRNAFFLIVLVFFQPGCTENAKQEEKPDMNNNAALFRKEIHTIYSDIMQDSFEIQVSLPAVYYQKDTVFPVIYSTDANRNFGIISDVVNALSFPANFIPDLIVVGIGYPIKGLEEWAARRHNDMTPTYDSTRSLNWKKMLEEISGRDDLVVSSGHSKEFLEFIKKELIPFIQSEYRASSIDRAVFGYSLGGLFSMYTLFESPATFQRYFAGSPSLWWDDGILLELEKRFSEAHHTLNANLFMSIGELEDNPGFWRMDSVLHAHNYEGLKIHTVEFQDQSHQTCYPEAVTKALMTLYNESEK